MINNSGGLGLVDLLEQIHLQEIIIIIPGNGWSLKEDQIIIITIKRAEV